MVFALSISLSCAIEYRHYDKTMAMLAFFSFVTLTVLSHKDKTKSTKK
jgi:hypothetical protein